MPLRQFCLVEFGDSGRSGEIGKYIDNVLALEGPCIPPEHYYFCSRIIHEHIGVYSKLSTTEIEAKQNRL